MDKRNQFKAYIYKLISPAAVLLMLVALFNSIVDPARLYFKKGTGKYEVFIQDLFQAPFGLVYLDIDPLRLKKELVAYSNSMDCLLLGSCHVFEISTVRKPAPVEEICQRFFNLSVAGAEIKDIFYFSTEIWKLEKKPNKVLIGMDYWIFENNELERLLDGFKESSEKKEANLPSGSNKRDSADFFWKKFENLFNANYFFRAHTNWKNVKKFRKRWFNLPHLDFNHGYEAEAVLVDGSRIHPFDPDPPPIPFEAKNWRLYKKNGPFIADPSLRAFAELISLYEKNGIEVILLFIPLHENIFKPINAVFASKVRNFQDAIERFAKDKGLTIIGSYDPNDLNCHPYEFYGLWTPKKTMPR